MSLARELMDSIESRTRRVDLFGFDPSPSEPWSYELSESSLLLIRLCEDINDIKHAETDLEALEIWEQIRPFIHTFHIGTLN